MNALVGARNGLPAGQGRVTKPKPGTEDGLFAARVTQFRARPTDILAVQGAGGRLAHGNPEMQYFVAHHGSSMSRSC